MKTFIEPNHFYRKTQKISTKKAEPTLTLPLMSDNSIHDYSAFGLTVFKCFSSGLFQPGKATASLNTSPAQLTF